MEGKGIRYTGNGLPVSLDSVPEVSTIEWRDAILMSGGNISALFGQPIGNNRFRLWAVLSFPLEGRLGLITTTVSDSYPALTPDLPEAHLFEREIYENIGIRPLGHPWLKPVRYTGPSGIGITDYFTVEGSEVHEVAVGPVHAGIIEPGHFRFQCHGERVLHLEISLGYQHRGVERALLGGPNKRTIHYIETLSGDTTIGHATAYAEAVESLSGTRVPLRAYAIRAIALELERMANHTGDLGALAGDVGYLPTASYCGRLRGEFLNMTAAICGSRFGRGLVRPGGTAFDIDDGMSKELGKRLDGTMRELEGAINMLWETSTVLARFDGIGTISKETCRELGMVGPAARACGIARDVRCDFPSGMYRFLQPLSPTLDTGDVYARAFIRWIEIERSKDLIIRLLNNLPTPQPSQSVGRLATDSCVVCLEEGWRGEICHVAITDSSGKYAMYKIVDPSFHNWMGLAMAIRGEQISDFPLCNKSFNLSYCGHDL